MGQTPMVNNAGRKLASMNPFSPVTDAELARAREDSAFKQRLLQQTLDALLTGMQRQRHARRSPPASEAQMREGVTLAVRLAEMIQAADAAKEP
jgi:hypothetical protein